MDELIADFVIETREMLERISEALLVWEAEPDSLVQLDEIFRFVHTVKGSCGFLELPRIAALAHAAETTLGEVRDGTRTPSAPLVATLLAIIDRIALLAEALETESSVPPIAEDDALMNALEAPDTPAIVAAMIPRHGTARHVRLPIEMLDTAMTQVSDLVLARNELAACLRGPSLDLASRAAFERVSTAIGEVRETIARTRMQPIERLFALLPRLVRDTSAACGKQVQLRIEGSDVEIDREMIEAMRDPLTHIVRNAIDHGIESPDERTRLGKPAAGTLTVVARQSGNQVSVSIGDDGRGIDSQALIAKALAAGMITADKAASLNADSVLELIFAPGLSTAMTVTDVSGRGVGMDIVRANIEQLGGSISLANRLGSGLTILLRAPLTLSIMNALQVEAGGQYFALPRATIDEVVSTRSLSVRVEPVGGGFIAVIRGRMLSVVSLAAMLGLRDELPSHLVIVDPPGGNRFALGVTDVLDLEELVVRPTSPHVAALGTYAGQTLPDNGIPMLVIDPSGLARRAGIDSERRHAPVPDATEIAVRPRGSMLLFEGLDGKRRGLRAIDIGRIDDVDASAITVHGREAFAMVDGDLMPVLIDGPVPCEGRLVLLWLDDRGSAIGYAVKPACDLVPIPAIAAVTDPLVEGLVLVDGGPVPLLVWPRPALTAKARRRA